VVGVEADVLEVVVFAAGADAFLGVGGAGVFGWADAGPFGDVGGAIAEEDGHELVHAGVGEEQAGRVRQQEADGTIVWPCLAKKSRKLWRIWAEVMTAKGTAKVVATTRRERRCRWRI
jgi:hypothetical protein